MPALTRRQTIQTKVETYEGFVATLTPSSDGVAVFDPSIQTIVDRVSREAAAPAIGRYPEPASRSRRTTSFTEDWVGSGSTTEPPWGRHLRACGYGGRRPYLYSLDGMTGTPIDGFKVGEKVYKSGEEATNYGMVISGEAPEGSDPNGTQSLVILHLVGGPFADNDAIVGKKGGTTATVNGTPTLDRNSYIPATEPTQRYSVPSWSLATAGFAAGDVCSVTRVVSGRTQIVGLVKFVADQSASPGDWEDFDGSLLWGSVSFATGDGLIHSGGATASLDAEPTMLDIPTLTIGHSVDNLFRSASGCRGSYTLSATAGEPFQWQWNFQGLKIASTTQALSSQLATDFKQPPRFAGPPSSAIHPMAFSISTGTNHEAISIRSCTITPGNSVVMQPDANGANGDHSAVVTDHDPEIVIVTDSVQAFPIQWDQLLDGQTQVAAMVRLEDSTYGTLTALAPAAQIVDLTDVSNDGIHGRQVTLKCRFWTDGTIQEIGGNQLIFSETSI